jgi:hypothetical protein
MRKLLITLAVLLASTQSARADIGLGIFIGEPTGLDLKIGLSQKSGLDILIGESTFREGHLSYGHVTYLLTPAVGHGDSILIPLRLGIGGAIFGITEDNVGFAVRVPFEIGLRFRRTPIEIYAEISFAIDFFTDNRNDKTAFDLGGGLGIRFYF